MHQTRLPLRRAALLAVLLGLAPACTTSLSSHQTARTLAPGHVQVTGAVTVPVATAAVAGAIDLGDSAVDSIETANDEGEALSDADQRDAIRSGLAIALFQPAAVPEAALRIGVIDRLDVGLHANAQLLKPDVKYMFWDNQEGMAAAVSLGYAYHLGIGSSFLAPLFDILEYVKLGDYSRHDLDLGLHLSRDVDEWLKLYVAARYLVSFVSLDADLKRVQDATDVDVIRISDVIHHYGGTGGVMVGYKYVYLHAELSVFGVQFAPNVLGEPVQLGGVVVAPSLGLTLTF
jgi:hypothetical protein